MTKITKDYGIYRKKVALSLERATFNGKALFSYVIHFLEV